MAKNDNSISRLQAPILVFDIETVPDIPLLFSTYTPPGMEGVEELSTWKNLELYEKICTASNIKFPVPIFHRVISICAIFINPETYNIMDGFKQTIPPPNSYAELNAEEAKLLTNFWEFCTKYRTFARVWYDRLLTDTYLSDYQKRKLKPLPLTFCGYNITGFDLPVIEQRSMKHLLTCPLPEYSKELGLDSYRYKYAQEKVFDLCDYISNYQSHTRTGLDTFARAIGLGGKMEGMDGSKVAHHFLNENNSKLIEEYCAIDVLITYGVLLAIQKFRGVINAGEYNDAVKHFEKFLLQEGKPFTYKMLADSSKQFFNTFPT